MAISVTNIGTGTVTGTSVAISVPVGGVPSGSLICGLIFESGTTASATTLTLSDSALNAYNSPSSLSGTPNNSTVIGKMQVAYAYNCAALVSGNSITAGSTVSGKTAVSVFYATGIATASDPLDTAASNEAAGSSAAPSVTMAAAPAVASSLCVGALATRGPSGDTFTQDSTNAAWATPPNRAGTTGGATSSNATVAGGTVVSSSQLTYAPAITGAGWVDIIAVFAPPSAAPSAPRNLMSTGFGTAIALEGARRILRNKPQTRREFITPWEN